ncbi:MAG TPA: hypothetical protein VJ765_13005 [Chitinophagaceae bacterium]|nr:hypothetical protein [Chitinophagaceae bacterium]
MKKTIYVSLIAFLILSGCTKAYNDLNVNPNENQLKSPPSNYTESHNGTSWYYYPLVCDGVITDNLWGNLDWHCTMHYVNGNLENMIMTYRGLLNSENTDEVFIIKETANWNHPQEGMITFQKNIRGDKGSHILIFGVVNLETWEITIEKTICQPN